MFYHSNSFNQFKSNVLSLIIDLTIIIYKNSLITFEEILRSVNLVFPPDFSIPFEVKSVISALQILHLENKF